MASRSLLALDVGEKRIGIATADTAVRIAIPYGAIEVDGGELTEIARIASLEKTDTIIVGYPRNQSGEATLQTAYVEGFASQLTDFAPHIVYQDESLTSVIAEDRLKSQKCNYTKGDIDAGAAAIILQDYLERHYA